MNEMEQLIRSNEGWYETGLLRRVGHPALPRNEKGSLARLLTLLKKLKRQPELYQEKKGCHQRLSESRNRRTSLVRCNALWEGILHPTWSSCSRAS